MRKTMFTLTMLLGAVAFIAVCSGPAMAAVTGACVNCHTMHSSQGDTASIPDSWDLSEPRGALLVNDCLGCHTTDGGLPLVDGYPYVAGSGFTNMNCLAGGFFDPAFLTTPSSDDNSDNYHSLGTTAAPAGYDSTEAPPGDWYTGGGTGGSDGLGCAGTNGCHGVHEVDDGGVLVPTSDDMESIRGGHHNPTAYRILFAGSGGMTAVQGDGAFNYEMDIIANPDTATIITDVGETQTVNLYSAGENDPSISELCAKCHGDFHGTDADTGGVSPWLRHPTDYPIPDDATSWPIFDATLTGSDYKFNPVGYDNATFGTQRRVTCLSCHRAHGTPYDDLLRFPYGDQDAGSTTVTQGCLGCHYKQRG